MTEDTATQSNETDPRFAIVRIYTKDVSFETPNSPAVFKQAWEPDVQLQLDTLVNALEDDFYEVILDITVTATQAEKTSFLVEIKQAGLFRIRDFDEAKKDSILGAYCPKTLFPFARAAISDLIAKGGFPQFLLTPINFDAMYANRSKRSDNLDAPAELESN